MKETRNDDKKGKQRDGEKDRRRSRGPREGEVRPGGTAPGKEREPRPERPAAKRGKGALASKKGSQR